MVEVSNPLMNYRWWLLQTLNRNRIDFAIVNILLVASFAGRVVLMVWLIFGKIVPRIPLFLENNQLLALGVGLFGHVVVCLMSIHWLRILLKGGVTNLCTFKPRPKDVKKQGPYH